MRVRLLLPTLLAAAAISAPPACADTPDPVAFSTHGSVVTNADGSRTLTVSGGTDPVADPGWQWPTQRSDCNLDAAGAGVAIAWNDPSDSGNLVTGDIAGVAYTVGVGASADNVVHPTPQIDPSKPAAHDIGTAADWRDWRGGCGVFVDHGALGAWSQGTWGPFSHTYPASVTGPLSACPLMYEVSGAGSGRAPLHQTEVIAGGTDHNADNSLQKNQWPVVGDGCFTAEFGGAHLSLAKQAALPGSSSYAESVVVDKGDQVRFRFVVTNDGTIGLTGVHVNELSELADCDESLESDTAFTGELKAGQSTVFTCEHTMGAKRLVNVATASGSYKLAGATVPVESARDTATVEVHPPKPVIAIQNIGPATATAGQPVGYVLVVTNPGEVAFVEPILVTDEQCDDQPVELIGKGGDLTPGLLEPGDVWTYACSARTDSQPRTIHNEARVDATDVNGQSASATDTSSTKLDNSDQLVLGERVTPGTARILGPTGCVARPFLMRVRGKSMDTVSLYFDGKLVNKIENAGSKTVFYRIVPAGLKIGVHKFTAVVTFKKGSGTKPRTLHLSFQRCARKLAAPRFTG